eukprot:9276791-Pyramimonas_sp.AAC.1
MFRTRPSAEGADRPRHARRDTAWCQPARRRLSGGTGVCRKGYLSLSLSRSVRRKGVLSNCDSSRPQGDGASQFTP